MTYFPHRAAAPRLGRVLVGAALVAAATSVAALTGCPGTLEPGEIGGTGGGAADAGGCLDVPEYFKTGCTASGCHGASSPSAELNLLDPDFPAMVGKSAVICTGSLIDAEAPENSVLYTKLSDDRPCGSRMPVGGVGLTTSELACVLEWIKTIDGVN